MELTTFYFFIWVTITNWCGYRIKGHKSLNHFVFIHPINSRKKNWHCLNEIQMSDVILEGASAHACYCSYISMVFAEEPNHEIWTCSLVEWERRGTGTWLVSKCHLQNPPRPIHICSLYEVSLSTTNFTFLILPDWKPKFLLHILFIFGQILPTPNIF